MLFCPPPAPVFTCQTRLDCRLHDGTPAFVRVLPRRDGGTIVEVGGIGDTVRFDPALLPELLPESVKAALHFRPCGENGARGP